VHTAQEQLVLARQHPETLLVPAESGSVVKQDICAGCASGMPFAGMRIALDLLTSPYKGVSAFPQTQPYHDHPLTANHLEDALLAFKGG
jgi:hypothetical protein